MVMFWFFRFGWAKPVPVNPYLFRNKRFGEIYVSLAGPVTNLILAIFSIMLFRTGITAVNNAFDSTVKLMIVYNVSFAVFNLLPIPPLDGSHVIKGILSPRLLAVYRQIEPFSMLVLILLLWTGFFSRFLGPIVYGIINSLDSIVIVIFSAIGVL
jgi:Zn-dependent protease